MKIYTVEQTDEFLTYQAKSYDVEKKPYLVFPKGTKWRGYTDQVSNLSRYCYSHQETFLNEALSECTYPNLEKMLDNLDIYLTRYPSAHHVNGAADGKGIILYGRGTQIPKGMTHYILMHELGHVLDYKFTRYLETKDFYDEYRRLRKWERDEKMDDWIEEKDLYWHEQVTEWFAEDFRYLFGGELAKQDYWGVSCDPPTEEIRQFMIEIGK